MILRELRTRKNPLQELFERTIYSFPLTPRTVMIEWLTDGLAFPESTENSEAYCAQAESKGIVPFSTQELYYQDGKGMQTFPIRPRYPIYSKNIFQRIQNGIQNKAQPHRRTLTLGTDTWMYGPQGMEERMTCLHTEILPLLKEERYQITKGEISVLETMGGYQQGEREVDTGVSFGIGGRRFYSTNALELMISLPETPEETKTSLLQWFATLHDVN